MTFLAPLAGLIAAAIAIPALLALYFLKLRRRRIDVSSTLLWRKAISDLHVNAPFQKLRRNLLLLLQLLALLALLLALARPTLRGPAVQGMRVVILIDQSASMNATDAKPTRLEQAKKLAQELVDNLGGQAKDGQTSGDGDAMVVTFGKQARVVQTMTGDRGLLRQAIESIQPTDEPGRLAPAMRLAEPFALETTDGGTKPKGVLVYVFSDGRVPDEAQATPQGAEVRYVRVGPTESQAMTDNVGIVTLAAKRDPRDPRRVQVLSQLENAGPSVVETNVTLSVGGKVERSMKLILPPAPSSDTTAALTTVPAEFDLELPDAAVLTVAHDHKDALATDNKASLVVAPPLKLRVLLVSDRANIFLQRAIKASGVERLATSTLAQYEGTDRSQLVRGAGGDAGAGFDVVVFDAVSPKAVPPIPSLSWGGAPPIAGLRRLAGPASEEKSRPQPVLDWKRDDAMLRYVAIDDLLMQSPGRLALPDDATILATAASGPVMAEVRSGGHRHVVTSFDLARTNWPLRVSFAVFVDNVLSDLGLGGGAAAGRWYQPGEVSVLPSARSSGRISLSGPEELAATVDQGVATLPMFRLTGLYRAASGLEAPWDKLPVNLCDELETDLRPAAVLRVGSTPAQAQSGSEVVRKEVWRWFVLAGLALLMVEWYVYTRRVQL